MQTSKCKILFTQEIYKQLMKSDPYFPFITFNERLVIEISFFTILVKIFQLISDFHSSLVFYF